MKELHSDWKVVEGNHLERTFRFSDFLSALQFVNEVGDLAEREGHHPDIFLSWGKVKITLYTHAIGGLSENDFILAAKIDTLYK
jgi:4a-hydroxytetrahydrobiopterin dehydratase